MIPPDIEMMIIQVSRPQDRSEAEAALVEQGLLPITLFADGPDNAFLVGAHTADLESAFAQAKERADGYGADRLALRMRMFSALSDAINSQFKYVADESEFPNGVTLLFVEAMVHVGILTPADIVPCAIRYLRSQMETPDFEEAPGDDVDLRGDSDTAQA